MDICRENVELTVASPHVQWKSSFAGKLPLVDSTTWNVYVNTEKGRSDKSAGPPYFQIAALVANLDG